MVLPSVMLLTVPILINPILFKTPPAKAIYICALLFVSNRQTSMSEATIRSQSLSQHLRLRAIISGCIGNLVEWYDWYAYAAFTIYFAPAFFPESDPTTQLLNSAGIFALGFLMRIAGGWLFGNLADYKGRKYAMSLSVLLMSGGSLMIALTPTYAYIGVVAPVLL